MRGRIMPSGITSDNLARLAKVSGTGNISYQGCSVYVSAGLRGYLVQVNLNRGGAGLDPAPPCASYLPRPNQPATASPNGSRSSSCG